ncbi:MAG TPA: sigma-54 dependent transcriptional regulator [Gemmatimonadales bacterium]|nr:sigma-54 dependent transcriptional regulator [Gemmatimonadales bacterium]
MPPKVYILDDDLSFAKLLAANLRGAGAFKIEVFDRADDLFARHAEEPSDAVITDLVMPNLDGVAVTRRLRAGAPHLPIFVLTAHAEIATAIEALKAGATEYLTKPVNLDELTTLLKRALKERPLIERAESLEETRRRDFSTGAILGADPKIEAVREFVRRVASAPGATVLLLGESGTGKNLVAQAIHYSGAPEGRGGGGGARSARFVEINCAALPPHLLEAELFGYQKGAFTDARESKRGLLEVAEEGTIFLDEIGELSPEFQAKLLNVLESRRFRRVGGTEELEVPARIVTATNRNLEQAVKAGRFRQDLYYRIRVATIVLPALREMEGDIPLLAEHFREFFSREFKKDVRRISPAALARLRAWHWPGNVRELRNVIERAMIFADSSELGVAHLPPLESLAAAPETAAAGATLVDAEKAHIERTLAAFNGNVQRAAEALGISRKNLWEKRKKYGLLE